MATEQKSANSPLPIEELSKVTSEACETTLAEVKEYDHTRVGDWNSQIINTILKSLIAATAPSTPSTPAPYRFTVNSTIVQQGVVDKATTADGEHSNAGKRGMHSAAGAFWDVNRDGMWTFKYPGAEERGLDVVVSVTWFAVG
ncbi:dynein light chain Tctex-type family protein [Aspergillus ruber CBS 135680]|uniref:Tctex-1 n=1 Tax=Aspergillus ruber (strain CBS 135680) TaxID=1388766 RepID=A0A017S6L0_ASPRC|nr:uncharacterized protein EURHEDRAFT_517461 [Aspergillus ruber CBS 135680]EYE92486.1 hypothetical protein EURHEDRAFT_517461 [Aspergillus ruber CBS 135680]